MALDTLGYAKKLQEAGVPSQQAEAHAEALRTVLEGDIATKQDIDLLRHEMRAMETRLEARLAEMETRLLVRLGTIVIGSMTILGAFMGILIALLRV